MTGGLRAGVSTIAARISSHYKSPVGRIDSPRLSGSPRDALSSIDQRNGPEPFDSGPSVLPATYAAICFTNGAVVLTSIFRGKAATLIGAAISNTPFTYSAVSFSTITPSGSVSDLSNTP
jgi:hypothetical protein